MSWIFKLLSCKINEINLCGGFSPLNRMILRENFVLGYFVFKVFCPKIFISNVHLGHWEEIARLLPWAHLGCCIEFSTKRIADLLFFFLFSFLFYNRTRGDKLFVLSEQIYGWVFPSDIGHHGGDNWEHPFSSLLSSIGSQTILL